MWWWGLCARLSSLRFGPVDIMVHFGYHLCQIFLDFEFRFQCFIVQFYLFYIEFQVYDSLICFLKLQCRVDVKHWRLWLTRLTLNSSLINYLRRQSFNLFWLECLTNNGHWLACHLSSCRLKVIRSLTSAFGLDALLELQKLLVYYLLLLLHYSSKRLYLLFCLIKLLFVFVKQLVIVYHFVWRCLGCDCLGSRGKAESREGELNMVLVRAGCANDSSERVSTKSWSEQLSKFAISIWNMSLHSSLALW